MMETLDVIKFICKDLWTVAFRKQIDNLKTNHRVRMGAKATDTTSRGGMDRKGRANAMGLM